MTRRARGVVLIRSARRTASARALLAGLLSRAIRIVLLGATASATAAAQRATAPLHSDVRQLVSFHFLPGRADSAFAIYERVLVPAYRDDTAMLRFRGYREAESPEPLDLLIVSHFDGMAGIDASNHALRQNSAAGRPVFAWYGALSDIAQSHRD